MLKAFPDGHWKEAKDFLEEKLKLFDTSDLELMLDHSMKRRNFVDGKAEPPKKHAKKDRTWRVRAKVGDSVKYPMEMQAPVASEQVDKLAAKLMDLSKPFEYLYDREAADDDQELMVWSAGWWLWWYLRKTKRVGGRAAKTDAARNAFEWMREFKKLRGKTVGEPKRFRRRDSPLGDVVGFMFG